MHEHKKNQFTFAGTILPKFYILTLSVLLMINDSDLSCSLITSNTDLVVLNTSQLQYDQLHSLSYIIIQDGHIEFFSHFKSTKVYCMWNINRNSVVLICSTLQYCT